VELHERLTKLRNQHGFTQQRVADSLGISRGAYANYEIGTREPDAENLKKLAELYNVTVDYLLTGRTDNINSQDPELDEHARELYELFKDDPESSSFWYEFKNSDPETRKKMIETWRIINELEKNRKPGDKQGHY
jgi:transcriptional regulator with XRE-family HTH domain